MIDRSVIVLLILLVFVMGCEFIVSTPVEDEPVALTNTTWWLAEIVDEEGESSSPGEHDLWVQFFNDGDIRGTSGTNHICGTYESSDDSLLIRELEVSPAWPPEQPQGPHAVRALLNTSEWTLRVENKNLVLSADVELVFKSGQEAENAGMLCA